MSKNSVGNSWELSKNGVEKKGFINKRVWILIGVATG